MHHPRILATRSGPGTWRRVSVLKPSTDTAWFNIALCAIVAFAGCTGDAAQDEVVPRAAASGTGQLHTAPDLPVAFCTDAPARLVNADSHVVVEQADEASEAGDEFAMDDIAVSETGTIFVLDKRLPGVLRFNREGKQLAQWGREGRGSSGADARPR